MFGRMLDQAPATRRGVAVAALLLLALGAWLLIEGRGSEPERFSQTPPEVGVARVVERDLEERIEALGTTAAWESIEICSTVIEFIEAIHFQDGQLVRRGDLLVTLVQDEERARLGEAQAVLSEQERELKRIEGLVAMKSLSRNQLDERRTLRDVAQARVAVAQAALADRVIRAPFDGMLGLRGPSVGALVTPQERITTLDDIAHLRLDFPVPSMQLAKLALGAPVRARSAALPGREFAGEVTSIDARVNPVDRSILVRARIDNTELLLKPGMLLDVDLQHESRRSLVVPEEALIHLQREHYVLLVDTADGNRLVRRNVVIGIREPGSVEVRSGLAAGDLVVVEGSSAARPGQQVTIHERNDAEKAG